jgi:ribosome-binding factor A
MPKEYSRTQRVGDYLQRELAGLIRTGLRDPRIGMVSITGVEVSRDLSYAKVFFSALGIDEPAAEKELVGVLNGATGFLRREIARDSTMRVVPALRFYFDRSIGHGMYMDKLIAEATAADRSRADATDDSDDA